MTAASVDALPEEDAILLAHVEDDYQNMKSRRQCSRRDFMDGYLAAAKRFSRPMKRVSRIPRVQRDAVERQLEAIS